MKRCHTKWFSKIVLEVYSIDIKSSSRNIEKFKFKIIKLEFIQ